MEHRCQKHHFFFFFALVILIIFPSAYAETMRAYLLADGQFSIPNDAIQLDGTSKLDVQNFTKNIIVFAKNIGNQTIPVTQQAQLVANIPGNPITLVNTELTTVSVSIPDQTTILGPASWDKTISPPKIITTSGNVPAGFVTPTSSIQVGNPNAVLVFNSPVTITLEGITGQIAYKLSGSNNWIPISTCIGSFENPTNPPSPNECSINNDIDTKILTFHFTEFASLGVVTSPSTPSVPSTSSTGGLGRIGVGPHSSKGGGGSMPIFVPDTPDVKIFPSWFQQSLTHWWVVGSISDGEFTNAISYLLDKKIIDIDVPKKPDTQLLELAPSMKHLFGLWSNNQLPDSSIIGLLHYYRSMGVW